MSGEYDENLIIGKTRPHGGEKTKKSFESLTPYENLRFNSGSKINYKK